MEQRQALIEALDLIKVMGGIIRQFDQCGDYGEYWLNDGDYVPAALEIARGLDEQEQAPAIDKSHDEPIQCAFTSPTREDRIVIVYKDGGFKIFDNTEGYDTAAVFYVEFEQAAEVMDKLGFEYSEGLYSFTLDAEEVFEIQQALQIYNILSRAKP